MQLLRAVPTPTERVARKNVAEDVDDPLAIQAFDLRRRGRPVEARHVADRHQRAVVCAHLDIHQRIDRRAVGRGNCYAQSTSPVGVRTFVATAPSTAMRATVATSDGVDAEQLALRAIDVDVHPRRAVLRAGLNVDGAGQRAQELRRPFRPPALSRHRDRSASRRSPRLSRRPCRRRPPSHRPGRDRRTCESCRRFVGVPATVLVHLALSCA